MNLKSIACLVVLSLFPAGANASEVYSYFGNTFTSTYGSLYTAPLNSPCGISCDLVTISFTVASPLGANFSGAVTPTSFTVSDGINTITGGNFLTIINAQFPSYPTFIVDTDASGQIAKWAIAVASTNSSSTDPFSDTIVSVGDIVINDVTSVGSPSIDIADAWNYCNLPNCGEETFAGQDYTPGVWTSAALRATPIPAALPLFASGLGVIGLLARSRKRKAAAIAA